MKGKLKKNIGFSLMPFALLFLFEPGYTVYDVLPDLIGYAILCLAVVNLADINTRVMDAYNGFRRALLISSLRIFAIYLLRTFFVEREQSVGVLLFAFIFSFAELVTVIPAYKSLFEGLLSLGMMQDGTAVYQKKRKKFTVRDAETGKKRICYRECGKNATERLYTLTVFFLIVHHCAMTLPEFTTLISNELYEFVLLLRGFGIVVSLPIGVIWLIAFRRYCANVAKDIPFINRLSEIYSKKLAEVPQYFTARELTTVLSLISAACILTIDFYADYINLIPDFFFYLVLIAVGVLVRRHSSRWSYLIASSFFGVITSAVAHFSATAFHSTYYPNAIRKNLDAYNAFYKMLAFHAVDAFILVLNAALLILVLWDVYRAHSDLSRSDNPVECRELTGRFKLFSALVMISAIFAGAASVYYIASQPFYYTGNWIYYYSTVNSVCVNLLFSCGCAYFVSFVSGAVKNRYRLYL